ncbi:hypothetical protein HMPREF0291_11895 [Corynebacterium genitalium ATCC 33030]|uniref:Uncharacterized protein n=1 Tax=Corynebacterium genitalium ATCC 33030 TaxID=585529 RepID=D7WDK7_9CORY|nr:hypothetical protein HMPREF0291_11895 [Corynebacterium genitalium ATCC 33030]
MRISVPRIKTVPAGDSSEFIADMKKVVLTDARAYAIEVERT